MWMICLTVCMAVPGNAVTCSARRMISYDMCDCRQVMEPNCIRLNRGNHESRQQNKLMGFEEEVTRRCIYDIHMVFGSPFRRASDSIDRESF